MQALSMRNMFLTAALALATTAILSAPAKAETPRATPTAKPAAKALAKPVPTVFTCSNPSSDLIESVNSQNIENLQTCLTQGADANAQQGEGFVSAALRGETDMVKAMLPYMNDVAALERSLAMAALRGHEEIVDLILTNPKVTLDLNKPGTRYLAYAARSGHVNILRKLVAAGARDDEGFAMASAIDGGQRSSFDYLLQDAKISPDAGNGMVLSMAIMSGNKHYVTALLDRGAEARFFPIVAESLADIRKHREGSGPEAAEYKKPVYDEIIALVEAAISKAEIKIASPITAKPVAPAPL